MWILISVKHNLLRMMSESEEIVVVTPEQCRVSLKEPGPRGSTAQCFLNRDRATDTYYLYRGLMSSETKKDQLLLAARKIKRLTGVEFVISMTSEDFSQASNNNLGILRSSLFGNKFIIYDGQPSCEVMSEAASRLSCWFNPNQVSPSVPLCHFPIGSISYKLNVLGITSGPRRMTCTMSYIPQSSVEAGGNAPTAASPSVSSLPYNDHSLDSKLKEPLIGINSFVPLILKSKAPRWHEKLQGWCLNFNGRVTMASVKNFQLVAAVDPSLSVSASEPERVILQFGRVDKDVFTMDYSYPLSAFEAFAICLSSLDTKLICD